VSAATDAVLDSESRVGHNRAVPSSMHKGEDMDQSGLSHEQAERLFDELERQRQAGQLSQADYAARLNALRVVDEYGRTWMLQEGSGQWHVYHDDAWVAATPPGREARPQATQAASGGKRSRPVASRRVGCFGLTLRIMVWDLLWLGIGYMVYQFAAPRLAWVMIPLGLVAAASLVWWIRRLTPRVPQGAQS
jgi:hypothetical protein